MTHFSLPTVDEVQWKMEEETEKDLELLGVHRDEKDVIWKGPL